MFKDNEYFLSPDDSDIVPIFNIQGDDHEEDPNEEFPSQMPLLALRNTVLFPGVIIPINIGRTESRKAVQHAFKGDKLIGVLTQKESEVDNPTMEDLYNIGTIARIIKLIKMPDNSTTAIIQGRARFELIDLVGESPFLLGEIKRLQMDALTGEPEYDAIVSTIRDKAKRIIDLAPNIPTEANMMLDNINSKDFLVNFIASNLNADIKGKQDILQISEPKEKATMVLMQINKELQVLELKSNIESKVKTDIEKQQRDYFLNQQLKTIQKELGNNPQESDIKRLIERAETMDWPESVETHFTKDIERIRRMNPQAAEYSIKLSYLETMLDLPWNKVTEDNFDLRSVQDILDEDHYGLDKVKERIIEHLAVLKLKGDMKSPILCLVGPPGVGKTSLGKSIAKALNRKYIRMSLGGLSDESEIRGHRKTYIGAMPGRIIQSIKKADSSNPVFVLDEIDKMGRDMRGDPSSALLEVLDPEQNGAFYDNYLELEYDLSKVLFIATSNSLNTIQRPLLDRMEIIQISGYSIEEKVEIARRHLIPKQLLEHGLVKDQVTIETTAISYLADKYTRESGVRSLDRVIAKVMRKLAKKVAMEENIPSELDIEKVKELMGPIIFDSDLAEEAKVPGVAIGLAWTSVGGDILFIESSLSKGKGKVTLTGNLGEVMKESATTALSFVKAHSQALGIDQTMFEEKDIHIHVPEGAIPKDGPSAGITMMTVLASAFTGKAVKPYLAMTGEITLRGKVLPVGGIKEKILAAKRAGIKQIILCNQNKKHVDEINEEYISGIDIVYVKNMVEVLDYALV